MATNIDMYGQSDVNVPATVIPIVTSPASLNINEEVRQLVAKKIKECCNGKLIDDSDQF